jgi:hypothetical protein
LSAVTAKGDRGIKRAIGNAALVSGAVRRILFIELSEMGSTILAEACYA